MSLIKDYLRKAAVFLILLILLPSGYLHALGAVKALRRVSECPDCTIHYGCEGITSFDFCREHEGILPQPTEARARRDELRRLYTQ